MKKCDVKRCKRKAKVFTKDRSLCEDHFHTMRQTMVETARINQIPINVQIENITFVSPKCFMCDKPWKHKVYAEGVDGAFYLCDDHLEHAKTKWKRRIRVAITPPEASLGKTCYRHACNGSELNNMGLRYSV